MQTFDNTELDAILAHGKINPQNKELLLLNPPDQATVKLLLNAGADVRAISSDWQAFNGMLHLNDKTTRVTYMKPLGYLRGVGPGRFDHVIGWRAPSAPSTTDLLCQARRATKFNGSVMIDVGEGIHVEEKPAGWMIGSYPRCGTHMLVTALANHPELSCFGEVFNVDSQNGTHRFPDPRQVLEGFWLEPNVGFAAHTYIGRRGGVHKYMAPQRWYNDFWDHLPKGIRMIQLRRRNLLRRFVSHKKSKQTGVWNRYGDDKKPLKKQVDIDVNDVLKDAEFAKACWKSTTNRYPNSLVVFYEDLCDHWEREMAKVQEFLGVQPFADIAPTSNKLARSLREDVANFDHVAQVLRKRGAGKWIDE